MMMYLDNDNNGFPKGINGDLFQRAQTYKRQTNQGMPGYVYKSSDGLNGIGNWMNWTDAIYPYLKSLNVFLCPTAKRNRQWSTLQQPVSYGYNPALNGCLVQFQPIVSKKLSLIKSPSRFIMLYDCSTVINMAVSGAWLVQSMSPGNWAVPHKDGINVGFADGHAKWFRYDNALISEGALDYTSTHWYVYPQPKH